MNTPALTSIAQVCHEANRAYRISLGEDPGPHWEDTPEETRNSAVQGVQNVLAGTDPEQSHANWLKFKIDHGWTYGEVKDEQAKTHPCLVEYHQLPVEQQIKDLLFTTIAGTLLYGEEVLHDND